MKLFLNTYYKTAKFVIHEVLEPRILLSGERLNNILPDPQQNTYLNNTLQVVQYTELLDISENIEERASYELAPSDSSNTDDCQPLFTLYVDDNNVNNKSSDTDLSAGDIGSTQIDEVLAVLSNNSDKYTESRIDTTKNGKMPIHTNDVDLSKEYTTSIEIRGPPTSDSFESVLSNTTLGDATLQAENGVLEETAENVQTKGIDLPGLNLVDPTVNHFDGQIVYLDFDGEEDVTYKGPVNVEGIDVPVFVATDELAGQEQVIITEVLGSLEHIFTGSGIIFTTERPSGNQLYSTTYVGGNNLAFADYGSFLGLAEQVDVGNTDRSDKAFVFSDNIVNGHTDPGSLVTHLTNLVCHETGHLLGYEHDTSHGLGQDLFGRCASSIIIDRNSIDITQIPESAILAAKANLHVGYGASSHGSQLINGWSEPTFAELNNFVSSGGLGLWLPSDTFTLNHNGSGGALEMCLNQAHFVGADDLGAPNRTAWANATRNFLDNVHPQANVIMWAWCGQVSTATEADINLYLNLMNQLELDYPNVQFVYMTGHLDGTGPQGNLNLRNEQIRQYCRDNDKILYDFADIESYDPDGLVNYMELGANDECYYDSDGDGSLDSNWAIDWQNSHTEGVDWYTCDALHTQPINANMKAYGLWWLLARLSGWSGVDDENTAPVLGTIGDKTVDEETLLAFTATASDPDIPANTLTFSLDPGAPVGAVIDPVTGVFTWTPTEAQGPGSYPVTVRVTDNGTPNLDDHGAITVTVNEVNVAPTLVAIGDKTVDEETLLTFTATASDPDIPANTLTFSLNPGAPVGAVIDPVTGVFTWTPTEAQGPGSYPVTVRVTDDGTPSLDDSEMITIIVSEVNTSPTVTVTAPNGGQDWSVGSLHDITWNATDNVGVTSVDLLYSSSGSGGSFISIASGEANDGTYLWIVPDDPTTNAFVKVVAHDAAGNSAEDTSDGPFTISDQTAPSQLRVDSLEVIPSGFITYFNRQIDPDVLNLYDTEAGIYGSTDFSVIGDTVGPVAGSLICNEDGTIVSFIKTGDPLEPDTYTITLRSGVGAFKDSEGHLLDGDGDDVEGGNYVTTITVEPTTDRLLSIPDFARGPGQEVNVPAGDSGIPVTISDGSNILAVDFVFDYNPALLNVTGVSLASGLPSGWGLVYNLNTPGHVPITIYGTTPLGAGEIRLIEIEANVPEDAPYRSAAILSLSGIQINEGAIASRSDCAVQVAAYFGDATGNHTYSGLDAAYIARAAVGLDGGFSAYRLKDPVIVADVTGNGRLSGLDAAYLARKAVGLEQPEIPDLPDPLPVIIAGGRDPLLSIPENLTAQQGSTVTVPILIDDATDLFLADIDLRYDTNVFNLNNSGVNLGDLTTGWNLISNIDDANGHVKLSAYSNSAISGGLGSIIELEFNVRSDAIPGITIIDLLESCSLNEGNLVLTLQDGEIEIQETTTIPILPAWKLNYNTDINFPGRLVDLVNCEIAVGSNDSDGDVESGINTIKKNDISQLYVNYNEMDIKETVSIGFRGSHWAILILKTQYVSAMKAKDQKLIRLILDDYVEKAQLSITLNLSRLYLVLRSNRPKL